MWEAEQCGHFMIYCHLQTYFYTRYATIKEVLYKYMLLLVKQYLNVLRINILTGKCMC